MGSLNNSTIILTTTPVPAPSGVPSVGVSVEAAHADHNHGSAIMGFTGGESAASGEIGEYITAQVMRSSPLALVSGVNTDLLSIVLPAGVWETYSQVGFHNPLGQISYIAASVSDASVTPAVDDLFEYSLLAPSYINAFATPIPLRRFNLAAPLTIYMVVHAIFVGGIMNCNGEIIAKRVF